MREEEKVIAVQQKNNQMESKLKKESVRKIDIAINPIIEQVQSENKEVLSPQNQVSILVVEDDEFYFSFIEIILFSFNYKVFHAKDGLEAINIYQSNNDIKLILMDIQMPVMDGFTATKEIRKTDTEIPIIAQTAFTGNGAKRKALLSGCNDFLLKPIEPKVLIRKMENFLNHTDQKISL